MADLRLQVILSALDKVTAPLKKIRDAATPTSGALKATSDRLKELNAQQKALDQFRGLHQGLSNTAKKLTAAQSSVNRLARELRATAAPTRAMTRDFNAAIKTARTLKIAHADQGQQLQHLRDRLSGAGISTRQLSHGQTGLKNSLRLTNAELISQQAKLTAIATQQNRLSAVRQHADKLRGTAGNLAMAGAGSMVTGRVMGTPLLKGLHEAKHYQTETGRIAALGLGDKVNNEAVQFARQMNTYGTSHLDNLEMLRDSMSIFGDLHHAKMVAPTLAQMKFGNKAFYGEEKGEDNERKFMDMLKVIEVRGGLSSPEAFRHQADMVQKVISATGGRVGPSEWLNMIKTGGVAAKGMKDNAFYYQMEPLVQELGGHRVGTGMMSAYNNLYQGRTTKRAAVNLGKLGLIGDMSKVKHDKVGQTTQLDAGALLGGDLFNSSQFEWMEKVLLPQLAQRGITEKRQVLDTIGSIFSNRTASDLFANMYLQRGQIHKNEQLNIGAYDIGQITALGKQQTSGRELDAIAKLADLKLALGENILPAYTRAVDTLTDAIQRLNQFMEDNPVLSKVMVIGLGAVAAVAVTLGAVMLAVSPFIAAYALLHVSFAKLGVAGGVLKPILRGMGGAMKWLGRMFFSVGRALLMNPIVLAITAIAVAAFLIYKYWEPIKEFFKELWDTITSTLQKAWDTISSTFSDMWTGLKTGFTDVMGWFDKLPARFVEFGANIMEGLAHGIRNAMSQVKSTVMGAGENVIAWFKEKLGIHSPSKVFEALGDYTMQGLAIGLQRGEEAPLAQVSRLAKQLTQIGAGIAIGAATVPAVAFDSRAPVPARASHPVQVIQGDTIHITVNPSVGMDEAAIARQVAQILETRDRQKAARRRSSLSDY